MAYLRTFTLGLGAVIVSTFTMLAHAFPIAASGTEGLNVLVGGTNPIIATYQGNSAAFSNDLYLMLNGAGNPGDDGITANDLFIFNNHSSVVGSTVNLGAFAIGTELEFRLHVNNTGNDFFTGVASRNPDNQTHARVQENWMPSETLVSFEDLFNEPFGEDLFNGPFGEDLFNEPFGYNDLSFSFTNTVTTTPPPTSGVPEPATLALLGLGLDGLGFSRRKQS